MANGYLLVKRRQGSRKGRGGIPLNDYLTGAEFFLKIGFQALQTYGR